jgi:protein transport protein SEC24
MCNVSNEVPPEYDWDRATNSQVDRWSRPELNRAVVEFVAPTEYMVRPPQPPVFVWLLDVSPAAVGSGMLATATRTILENLDRIPNTDGRTKVAVIAFDVALHFFSLVTPAGGGGETTAPLVDTEDGEEVAAAQVEQEPEINMMVVSDLEDVYLPRPNDLLVNLKDNRKPLENLLGRLNEMFAGGSFSSRVPVISLADFILWIGAGGPAPPAMPGVPQGPSALGPGLQAGYKMIVRLLSFSSIDGTLIMSQSPIGGKLQVFSASLPTLGAGALKDRDDPKLFGTAKVCLCMEFR